MEWAEAWICKIITRTLPSPCLVTLCWRVLARYLRKSSPTFFMTQAKIKNGLYVFRFIARCHNTGHSSLPSQVVSNHRQSSLLHDRLNIKLTSTLLGFSSILAFRDIQILCPQQITTHRCQIRRRIALARLFYYIDILVVHFQIFHRPLRHTYYTHHHLLFFARKTGF